MSRLRFEGQIAGLGSTSGVRVVVGHWTQSPYGSFTDVMLQRADGWRVLLAPTVEVADFVASTYAFDQVVVGPVSWTRAGATVSVCAPGLDIGFVVGERTWLGKLLRLVPRRVAVAPRWARLIAPASGLLVPGVRTYGSAGGGRWEAYGATDLHRISRLDGSWQGRPVGDLTPIEPPVTVGFASTPRRPGLTTLVTTIGLPSRSASLSLHLPSRSGSSSLLGLQPEREAGSRARMGRRGEIDRGNGPTARGVG